MTKIEKAVTWALAIANDNTHGYDQQYRWGPDYDCSSLIISAWQQAGVPVKTKGAYFSSAALLFPNSRLEVPWRTYHNISL